MSLLKKMENRGHLLLEYLFLSVTLWQIVFVLWNWVSNEFIIVSIWWIIPFISVVSSDNLWLEFCIVNKFLFVSAFLVHYFTFILCVSLTVRYISCSCFLGISESTSCNWPIRFYRNVHFGVPPVSILLHWEVQVLKKSTTYQLVKGQ